MTKARSLGYRIGKCIASALVRIVRARPGATPPALPITNNRPAQSSERAIEVDMWGKPKYWEYPESEADRHGWLEEEREGSGDAR